MPPPGLAHGMRAPLPGVMRGRALNYGSPVSPRKLLLYYPGSDGHVEGFHNIVPPQQSGLVSPGSQAGKMVLNSLGNLNAIDFEGHGPVIRNPSSGTGYVGLNVAEFTNLSPTSWTAFCWIRPYAVTSAGGHLIAHGDGSFVSYNVGLSIAATTNTFNAFATIGGGFNFKDAVSSTIALAGHRYFVAGTWDASNVKIYINGRLEQSDTTGGNADSDGSIWRIGSHSTGINFNGKIWNVGVFGRALSAWEVAYLYAHPWTLVDGHFDNYPRGGGGGSWRL